MAALLGGGIAAGSAFGATTTTPAASDSDVATALTFAREEERMARDLYAALAAEYDGARPFSTITRSEDRHFDAIGTLLDRYDVTDPSAGKAAGSYAVEAVQDLYDGWLEEGRTSLDAAYRVGVELEQRDIDDLEKSIADDLPSDVDVVLGHLLEGSKHHLAAYERAVAGDLGTGTGGRWGDTDATPNGTPRNGAPGMMNGRNGQGKGMGNGPGNGSPGSGNGPGTGDCPYTDTDD
ncbi:hypothetical protein GCM10023168_06470 [Fodinibacter luteus]|uniref:DUF2202 domain-containing protein n=1 Tax=Fodinibacter luteus TaxID=552064 RepID=A0ABP8K2C8_9MICO